MTTPIQRFALFIVPVALLVACDRNTPPAEPPAALARPLLTLSAQTGRVLIPETAVLVRGGVPGVLVVNPERQARFRMVRTGKAHNGRVEILSGLRGDETLVTGDLADVRDGSIVTPVTNAKSP